MLRRVISTGGLACDLHPEVLMRIGFIGLGSMGQGMARHLVKGGHEVRVWNRTAARAKPLVAAGATLAKTIGAACEDAGRRRCGAD